MNLHGTKYGLIPVAVNSGLMRKDRRSRWSSSGDLTRIYCGTTHDFPTQTQHGQPSTLGDGLAQGKCQAAWMALSYAT